MKTAIGNGEPTLVEVPLPQLPPEEQPKTAGNGTSRREAAALALAKGLSVADAAKEANIGVRTLYTWRKDSSFSAMVQSFRAELFTEALGKLSGLATKAAETMGDLLDSEHDGIRLGAATRIIEAATKLREMIDLSEQLAALREQVEDLVSVAKK
jgi:hypothetical protein